MSRASYTNAYSGTSVVYQWINIITGSTYVGSAVDGNDRLSRYWYVSSLSASRQLERDISKYGHACFAVAILEIVGTPGTPVSEETVRAQEQVYLDLLFANYRSGRIMNVSKIAGKTTGYRHTSEYIASRSGKNSPHYENVNIPAELNNKSKNLVRIIIYGYILLILSLCREDGEFLGEFATRRVPGVFGLSSKTLQKVLKTGEVYKGKLYTREKR